MRTQAEKARAFQALHRREGAFIIPNPFDVGTAKILEHLGFEALATTSAGYANTRGKLDYGLTRDQVLHHASEIVAATNIPVSADLEGGFGDDPETVAETYRLAAATGLAGGSIEDATNREGDPIYEFGLAVARVRAAAEAVHSLPYPFMLTARCENYLHDLADLNDTIKRLQAYQEAGADVLYAPGIRTKEDIVALVTSVDRPVNFLASMKDIGFSLAELSAMGVKRVSLGSALARAAMSGFLSAAREMVEQGSFSFTNDIVASPEMSAAFSHETGAQEN